MMCSSTQFPRPSSSLIPVTAKILSEADEAGSSVFALAVRLGWTIGPPFWVDVRLWPLRRVRPPIADASKAAGVGDLHKLSRSGHDIPIDLLHLRWINRE